MTMTAELPVPSTECVETWWEAIVGPDFGCQPQHVELARRAATWGAEKQLARCSEWAQEQWGAGEQMLGDVLDGSIRPRRDRALEALERLVRGKSDPVQEAEDVTLLYNLLEGLS